MKKRFWIQKAIVRPGSLHRQLKIAKGVKIPTSLLNKIISARAGQTIKNTSGVGKKVVRVTRRLERKAILAKNLKGLK